MFHFIAFLLPKPDQLLSGLVGQPDANNQQMSAGLAHHAQYLLCLTVSMAMFHLAEIPHLLSQGPIEFLGHQGPRSMVTNTKEQAHFQ